MSGKIEALSAPAIVPIYWQTSPDEEINFGTIKMEFCVGNQTWLEDATACMRFSPRDRLLFTMSKSLPTHRDIRKLWDADSFKARLPGRGVEFDAHCTHLGTDAIIVTPNSSAVTVTTPAENLVGLTFHLFNFPDFSGPGDYNLVKGDPPRQSLRRCGRIQITIDGWDICVAGTSATHELVEILKKEGGYAITHCGAITREGTEEFSSQQSDELLTCLHYFLSFATGRWAGLSLPVGRDVNGNRVFEQWGMRRTAEGTWNGSLSWFDSQHSRLLGQVLPGFYRLWKSSLWNIALKHSLYWYVAANAGGTGMGVDTGLVLAQNALELLAWNYCVQDRKMVSKAAFGPRGISAADKLRLFATSLALPSGIPDTLTALQKKPGRKWVDSFDAVTAIRNSLVHPDADLKLIEGAYYEAWRLSMWYLDLMFLRLCGHQGKYANRLSAGFVGQVEDMPLASTSSIL